MAQIVNIKTRNVIVTPIKPREVRVRRISVQALNALRALGIKVVLV